MIADGATARSAIEMSAVTLFGLSDQIRRLEIPHHDPLGYVLSGKWEDHAATGSLAQVHTILAVDLYFELRRVLILIRFLQDGAHTLAQEAFFQPTSNLVFPRVQLFY